MTQKDELKAALSALESERVESVRLRRQLLDMLYNLDEENMPVIVERLRAAEKALAEQNESLALLFSTDEEGEPTLSVEALVSAINENGGLSLILGALSLLSGNEGVSLSPEGVALSRTDKTHPPVTYTYALSLSPDALEMKVVDGQSAASGDTLTLSPRGLCLPYLRRKAANKTSGLYPLYLDKDGNIIATFP